VFVLEVAAAAGVTRQRLLLSFYSAQFGAQRRGCGEGRQ
jgi:hypothetical protein